ncbi:MAG TPA: HAMP domain-containing sensor histidine kinase [Anaeromyxobacter sp.]|nr:HAMP domain-containing sensor histidine kinase [Anaeromyxobacter sp.]
MAGVGRPDDPDACFVATDLRRASNVEDEEMSQEELMQTLAFREQVIGILGHDLRNPLGAVRVLVTLLLRREDLPEPVRGSLEEIDRAGNRMLEMIETMLDFSESWSRGNWPVVAVPADMHDLCRRVVEELLAAAPGRAIDLDVEGDGWGTWDPARLAQVVSNLVGNALEHGGGHERVRVSVRGDEDEVVLTVENHGPPIAPEILPVLFEPFRRGATSRGSSHARGLGLGLHIVRQIVDAHGGAISVQSAEQGTTFTVTLPRATGVRADEAQRFGLDEAFLRRAREGPAARASRSTDGPSAVPDTSR